MGIVEESVTLPCGATEAFDQWLQVVWRQGGGLGSCSVLEPGDAVTAVGCERRVMGGIRERILEAERPSRIQYTVVAGLFPVSKHLGEVTFHPADASAGESKQQTTIKWKCTYTPRFWGLEWVLAKTISFSFSHMLATLAAAVKKSQPST